MARTVPALRQAIYAALTGLSYNVNAGASQTLAATNLRAGRQYFDGVPPATVPEPFVTYDVADAGSISLQIPDRRVRITITASSGVQGGDDIVTEIVEAVRAKLLSAGEGFSSLSRAATGSTLGVSVREVRDRGSLAAAYEKDSSRWYASVSLSAIAIAI